MPSPHKRSFAAEELKRRQKKKPWLWIVEGIVVIAILAGGYVLYKRLETQRQVETKNKQIKSIAVLPFRDLSPEKDQDWFCEGIAERILDNLSNIESLKVSGSTSSFSFKGTGADIPEIGKKLKVESVLEGSIIKSGNRLSITAQLIKVDDGYHIWSKTYDRQTEDVFPLIEEISLKIVEALKIDLLSTEKAAIEKRPTENIEAYNYYLQGRYHWNKRTVPDFQEALKYYQQALEKDSRYALAYAGIADVYNLMTGYGLLPEEEGFKKAKEMAERALDIDDTIAEAYVALAYVNMYYDRDLPAAERILKHAIEINPTCEVARHKYHDYLLIRGKLEEAISQLNQALEIDPLSFLRLILTNDFIDSGNYNKAKEQINIIKELFQSNKEYPCLMLGLLYYHQGDYKKAMEEYEKVFELIDRAQYLKNYVASPAMLFIPLGYAYGMTGEKEKAEQIINELMELNKERNDVFLVGIAMIYSGIGEVDKVFEWLEKAHKKNKSFSLKRKEFDNLRPDPRYKALLKKMGLPED